MKKQYIHKILAYAMLILTFTAFFGCSHKQKENESTTTKDTQETAKELEEMYDTKVVSILVDLPAEAEYSPLVLALQESINRIPGYGREFTVKIESVSARGQERDMAFTRLRTEIMAGKGPDLFLCSQRLYGVSAGSNDESFFNFPVQTMSNHIFLQLDDYIDKAEFMEWDKLLPVVMEAGRNEEGQQIIPLAYTFTVTFIDKDTYTLKNQTPMSWEEMIESPDAEIRASAMVLLADTIGNLADYSKDTPAFTEEELLAWAGKDFELRKSIPENGPEYVTIPVDRQTLTWFEVDLGGEQEYTMIPAYNLSGGITANITTFAAINRNARRPDEAFKIIDYLLSPKIQQSSPVFQTRMEGLPVYMETGSSDTPRDSYWQMSEANYKTLSTLQEQINIAQFPGPLDLAIWGIEKRTPKIREKSVHEQYVLMEMLLAES